VSLPLLVFHSTASAMRRALWQLSETLLLAAACEPVLDPASPAGRGRYLRRDPAAVAAAAAARLPMSRDSVSTVGGLLCVQHLAQPATSLAAIFPTCVRPAADVTAAHRLWRAVGSGVRVLLGTEEEGERGLAAWLDDWAAADAILKRASAPI
jgi:hypothetical protein